MNPSADFKNHCAEYGFKWRDSDPVVSRNPKLLFNISGGVPFEDIISYGYPTENPRVASVQQCLRTDCWEKVGKSGRHHLCFQMLGHFSFHELEGFAAKELMIKTALDFLIGAVGLDLNRLSATIHPQDEDCRKIWNSLKVTVAESQDNTTATPQNSRCGFRTEIVWRQNDGRQIELWNIVFTQFLGSELLKQPLSKIVCDSGISVDRLISAQEDVNSDYENSAWKGVIATLSNCAGRKTYAQICRISDLAKAAGTLIGEGVVPGNKTTEYVLRKIIRESYVLCKIVSLPFGDFITVGKNNYSADPQIFENVVTEESARFENGLKRGEREMEKIMKKKGSISDKDADYLSSTFGYPSALIPGRDKND